MISRTENSYDGDELLDEAIAEFLRAESAGKAGDRQQWLDRYPACATGLLEFFEDRQRVDRLMMPSRNDRTSPAGIDAADGNSDSQAKVDTVDFVPQPPQFTSTRYRPLRFHARGGMGEIWLAEDEQIGRQVAIKKLRACRKDREARFLVEAQVTGQLEHPSVVPLHDLGIDDVGQPFYVMKFIHGRKLSDAVTDFHLHKSSADWTHDLQFRRLLETFVNVCNAVAYAHSKGVLHRDIKPDNVMLGPFGETLVVDWGLAKVIGQPEGRRGASVQLSGSASSATQDGAIVGSPLYMSPEGAEGRAEEVDQSSDVYLLGATLYEILTARPPREGSSHSELIELARKSRPTAPRKLDSNIPRALEAICLKAMAFRKQNRYDTPLALAEDIQGFLAGEPTTAYREPLLARCARWLRRHRRGLLRGLSVLCVLILSGVALLSYHQALVFAEREEAREQLSRFYRLADEAQFFAANSDAISERVPYYDPHRAEAIGQAALTIAAGWGEQAQQLPLPDQRAEFLQAQYALLLLLARVDLQADREAANPRYGLALLDQALAIEQPTRGYFQLRARYLALLGQPDAARQADLQASQPDTPLSAQDHFIQGELLRFEDAGSSAKVTDAGSEPNRDHLAKAIEEYRSALHIDPRFYWARFQLGRCLLAIGRAGEATEALSTCVALRPASPWAYTTRGLANALSGHSKEALIDLDEALRHDPDFQPARLNRGIAHWLAKDNEAAIVDFDAALAAPTDKRLIEAAFYRGQVLLSARKADQAFSALSMVIDSEPDFRPAYWFRAQAQFRLGKSEQGRLDLVKFTAIKNSPPQSESSARRHLAAGKALRQLGQELDGEARAQALVRAADELQAAIAAGTPTAEVYQHLGAVYESIGKIQLAVESYTQGLAVAADNVALRNLRGWAYVVKKQFDLARADFTEAVRLAPENAESHAGLGFVLAELAIGDDARKEASEALLSGSESYLVLHNVACIYGRLSESSGQRIEDENLALAALKQAVGLSRRKPVRPDADEVALIHQETAFPDSLRSRPEFKRLLKEAAADNR